MRTGATKARTMARRRPCVAMERRKAIGIFVTAAFLAAARCGCALAAPPAPGAIDAVGAENEYADVIGQIGGRFVRVTAIETDPNTDPHDFEVSPKVAAEIAFAELVVKNGLGYDSWADKMIAAAPKADRKVIDVQQLLALPDRTPNPHLWYDPRTMPAVAKAVAEALSALKPAETLYFQDNLKRFDASLKPWSAAIAAFKAKYGGTPVAVTEPVADYMLQAAGCDILTPFSLQAAIMNGTDPSPQDITLQNGLLGGRRVRVFVYNQQVTDTLTQSFLNLAKKNGIPVVGVYETMPIPGYDYQSWMLAEMAALRKAVADRISTETLQPKH